MQPTMKGIAFCGDRTVTVRDWPMPVPGPGQVLVQLKRANGSLFIRAGQIDQSEDL